MTFRKTLCYVIWQETQLIPCHMKPAYLFWGARTHRSYRLQPGDELSFAAGSTFYLMGGIVSSGLSNVTLRFDSTINFCDELQEWPRRSDGSVSRPNAVQRSPQPQGVG